MYIHTHIHTHTHKFKTIKAGVQPNGTTLAYHAYGPELKLKN